MLTKLLLCAALITAVASVNGQQIEFTAPNVYPEGIVYDSQKKVYYVSSVRTGAIGRVDASGQYSELYSDSSLKSSFGMKLSMDGKRLWVCVGDPSYSKFRDSSTFKKMIRVIAIDVTSRQKVADTDLSNLYPGKHFANDLTVDNAGNLYITDSYSPVIYKVASNGQASVFSESNLFKSVGVGLNGIVWHPKGFLLVVNNGNGVLLKVDISNPAIVNKIGVPQFFPGADGLLLDGEQNLMLVQNKGVNRVFKLTTSDVWKTAKVTSATGSELKLNFPSTITKTSTDTWVLNARLSDLSDSTTIPAKTFSMQKLTFKPMSK